MIHYTLFSTLYHGIYLPLLGMHSGPEVTRGHAGYPTTHGLAAFLRVWARHLARHHAFTGRAWAVKHGASLAGSTRHAITLRLIRTGSWFRTYGAYVGKQLIHKTVIWR